MSKASAIKIAVRMFIVTAQITVCPLALALDRDAIWKVVKDKCLLNEKNNSKPDPCTELYPNKDGKVGYAVLKDLKGSAHYLIIPTDQISGIESPDVIKPSGENWFSFAWQARDLLNKATGHQIPRDDVALAINSVEGRGQDQLHIHLSCILPSVKAEINKQAKDIETHWSNQYIDLDNKHFFAERVDHSTLSDFNPIKAVADQIPGAKADMGRMTIIVVGASESNKRDGFLVFAGKTDEKTGDRGKAEDLLDNDCAHAARK